MGLEQIIPAIFLIAILVLVLPSFLRSNIKSKQFLIILFIWSIIVTFIVVVSIFVFK